MGCMYITAAQIIAFVLCALCTVCGGQRSALFSAVQLAGRTQCSPDPPLLTFTARSRLDCSEQCAALGYESCVAFNFKQPSSCELFSESISSYSVKSGCELYQIQYETNADACSFSPCFNNGTCTGTPNTLTYTCTCPLLFGGKQCQLFACDEYEQEGYPSKAWVFSGLKGKVGVCENSDNTTWLVIQKRFDGSVDFYRNSTDYEFGFSINGFGEQWLGNFYLAELTATTPYRLRVDLSDWDGNTSYAEYSSFVVGGAATNYTLVSIGTYSGTAGDGLNYHLGMQFTTYDADHGPAGYNCAAFAHGAWWYNNCYNSNLNGCYYNTGWRQGMVWGPWRGYDYSLKTAKMKMRPGNA